MAYEEDSSNNNGQRVLQQGYQVNLRPRTLPLDVKIEIDHDGITMTVLEMIAGVAEVQQAFANSFSAKHVERQLHILRHVREKCKREPCGDVWQEVGDIQRGESHLPPMGARLCCRPEDVIACCACGLSDAIIATLMLARRKRHGGCIRRMGSLDGKFAGAIPKHTLASRVLAVCSVDSTGGTAVSFICVRVRKHFFST